MRVWVVAQAFASGGVPDLDVTLERADGEIVSFVYPAERGDLVMLAQIAQLGYLGRLCAPKVHTRPQPDAEDVGRAPVHKVEVEVVRQVWCVEDPVRCLGHNPQRLLGALEVVFRFFAHWSVHVRVRARVILPRVPWGCTSGFGGRVDREDLFTRGRRGHTVCGWAWSDWGDRSRRGFMVRFFNLRAKHCRKGCVRLFWGTGLAWTRHCNLKFK